GGCTEDDNSDDLARTQESQLTVSVMSSNSASASTGDSSADSSLITSAMLTIDGVYLVEESDTEGEASADVEAMTLISSESQTIDLVQLETEVAAIIEGASVQSGTYSGVYLDVSDAAVSAESDGETFLFVTSEDVNVSSDAQLAGFIEISDSEGHSGISLSFDNSLNVEGGEDYEVLLDLNAEAMFSSTVAVMIDTYIELRAEAEEESDVEEGGGSVDIDVSGDVQGVVDLDSEDGSASDVTGHGSITVDVTSSESGLFSQLTADLSALIGTEIVIVDAQGEVASTLAVGDDSGLEASFEFVDPDNGPYDIQIVSPLVSFELSTESTTTVDLSEGEDVTVNLVVTSVTTVSSDDE
ncbi:MAG: DUF4382 domain-containing protein, partial [Myxococcales bacterium]|nr:DUF4382 domain-containing protein [Myxococcales bacterium]